MSTTAMGFDFGTKRIGVAAGQNLTGTAQGIATVRAIVTLGSGAHRLGAAGGE